MTANAVHEFEDQTRRRSDSPQPDRRWRWWRGWLMLASIAAMAVCAAALIFAAGAPPEEGIVPTHTVTRGEVLVTVTEQGTLASANNTELKCNVRGANTIISVIGSGTEVMPGDELVRLDTLALEEEISERAKFAHLSQSVAERSKADVANAELAIPEYLEGSYVTQLAELETNLAIAESRLLSSENMLNHARMMAESRYVSELDVEEKEFAHAQADLDVTLKRTQIDVLKQFTKAERLATLKGDLSAAQAQYEADKERWDADEERLRLAKQELQHCVVTAERRGIVIYPTVEAWEEKPEIEEGATVHKDQILLLMPDLTNMQVKVGIHESVIDRIQPGLAAKVTLPKITLDGEVTSVSPVTRPAGWWTGNVVKYDTIIKLPSVAGLKPGMSASVEVILARHENVLVIPTAAVLESARGYACWVVTAEGTRRRTLQLGDSSEMSIVVEQGLREGDEVVLNPLAFVEEAQREAAMTLNEEPSPDPERSAF